MDIARDALAAARGELHHVFTDDKFQLTGLSVSKSGRLFVDYPRWSDRYLNAVVEVLEDGVVRPFRTRRGTAGI